MLTLCPFTAEKSSRYVAPVVPRHQSSLCLSVDDEDKVMEEGFLDDAAESENEPVSKAQAVKNTLEKRRLLDDVLIEHRLRRELKDYDFDLDD